MCLLLGCVCVHMGGDLSSFCVHLFLLFSLVLLLRESTEKEVGKNLDDYGAIVPPHLAKGLEAE